MPYYNIRVQSIAEDGCDLDASYTKDEWFRRVIGDAVEAEHSGIDATLSAGIAKSGRSIEVTGGVYLRLRVACSRCLEGIDFEEQIPFRFILEPQPNPEGRGGVDEDRAEEMSEFLDFSYYAGDEIDLGDLIRQHITMAQPISYICREDCKGLCQKCGKNLNEGPCGCKIDHNDSPFAILKDLKKGD